MEETQKKIIDVPKKIIPKLKAIAKSNSRTVKAEIEHQIKKLIEKSQ